MRGGVNDDPDAARDRAAPRYPPPLRPRAARPETVKTGKGEQDYDIQKRPAREGEKSRSRLGRNAQELQRYRDRDDACHGDNDKDNRPKRKRERP